MKPYTQDNCRSEFRKIVLVAGDLSNSYFKYAEKRTTVSTLKETESSVVRKVEIAEKSSKVSGKEILKPQYACKNLTLISLWLITLQ